MTISQITKLYNHPRDDKGQLIPQYDSTPEELSQERWEKAHMLALSDADLRRLEEHEMADFVKTLASMDDDEREAWMKEKRRLFAKRRKKHGR